ncbi:MAG: aminotransferase class I/II-fold pyridoxal phosphate-dependent enzyme [Alphaproteobacteria bacterium]
MGAGYKLSASAAEPMGLEELLAMEPGASDMLTKFALDYPRRYGPDELREKIAAKYEGIDTDSALITSGVDEGLGLLFVSLVEPGDRVVILTPCYTPHLDLPRWRGATVVPWSAREENDWIPGLDELRSLLRDRTKLVVATFPQNPTGFMPDDDYMAEFINILRDSGALLLSDEIYAGLPIDGAPLPNLACRHERAISLHGLSKTCGLPGLRVGWLVTRDQAAMNAIKESKNLFNAYLPAPIEFLTGLALRHEQELKSRNSDIFATSLKAANSFFKRHDNLFAWSPPEAGVLSFPRWLGPGGTKELSDRLIEEVSIALAPSLCFDAGDNHFRVGLCRRSFPEALERLDDFCTTKL